MGLSVADLDRDGQLDIVVTNYATFGEEGHGSFIYWGSSDGYATCGRTSLPTDGAMTALLVDLNADNCLDVCFGARDGERGAVVYWGDGTRDYGTGRQTFIPDSLGTTYPNAADVNRDGHLDLLLLRSAGATDRCAQSFVYLAGEHGQFSRERRLEFPTVGALTSTFADFNEDGWVDLVVPAYGTGKTRKTNSRLFWGGPDGYSDQRMTLLPSNGGAGALAADFNRDGHRDLLIVCHRREGDPSKIGVFNDHVTNSLIYWGSADGFDTDHTLGILSEGAHQSYGVDVGDIYYRQFELEYISSPHECGAAVPTRIDWKSTSRPRSRLRFQIRAAATRAELSSAAWLGAGGSGTFFERPGTPIRGAAHPWIQYRVVFVSLDGVDYPRLDEVAIHFAPAAP
jgi:hypothetical protein